MALGTLKGLIKRGIMRRVPLAARKRLAVWIGAQQWLGTARAAWWSAELVRDLADRDINEYHRFLWSHHLSYAAPYEVGARFGEENMKGSRRLFFADLKGHLAASSVDPELQIRSALEVGCSSGYQLRYMETAVFPAASELCGFDIDAYAVDAGARYLAGIGSKVRLAAGDMLRFDQLTDGRRFDVIVCSGVLMYLEEASAARLVESMLGRTSVMLACAGLAHPDRDNATLGHSVPRKSDHTFIHNIDRMVERAGGRVVARRWEGGEHRHGHTIYFVFARRA